MPYSVCGIFINNAYQTINDATYEMANEQDDVVQVGPTYVTPDYEGGHLAMNGYRWFGEYCAKALYYVFLKHMDFRPLQPYRFDIKGNKVYIYMRRSAMCHDLGWASLYIRLSCSNVVCVYISVAFRL